jgi:hypothetical protein
MTKWSLILILAAGCSAAPGPTPTGDTKQSMPMMMAEGDAGTTTPKMTIADVQPIFDMYCTRCHATRAPFLTAGDAPTALAGTSSCNNMKYIEPGQPEQSFLFYKIGGMSTLSVAGTTCREKMPNDGPALNAADPDAVEKIRQWIADGAN